MARDEFFEKAQAIRDWFKPLNPYAVNVELFKVEDANYRIADGKLTPELEPLYCFAISSKRYALFNMGTDGSPVLRKASAHGLGHLIPPYGDDDAPADLPKPLIDLHEIGVSRWQHDFWHCIVSAVLSGNPDCPDYSKLPNFHLPAVSQYTATTAHLLKWFERYNLDKPYAGQVRPFNFMLMYQPHPLADWSAWRLANGIEDTGSGPPSVIAPYNRDLRRAVSGCFDRDTGAPVPVNMLKTYAQSLAQYHLRPETKFLDADYLDSGLVRRRHVKAGAVVYIGKEANRWEEQSYLGIDPEAEIVYGTAHDDRAKVIDQARKAAGAYGQRALANASGITPQQLSAILRRAAVPTDATLAKLAQGMLELERASADERRCTETALEKIRRLAAESSLREVARRFRIDPGNLARMLNGGRKLSASLLTRLKQIADD